MSIANTFERGTLNLAEQEALFRSAMAEEVVKATAHVTAPIDAVQQTPAFHKVMAAANRIVARVAPDAPGIEARHLEAEIDGSWSVSERALLERTLAIFVTPASVTPSDADAALEALGTPKNAGTLREARSHILRGRAEAHLRAPLLDAEPIRSSGKGIAALLDDELVAQSRTIQRVPAHAVCSTVPDAPLPAAAAPVMQAPPTTEFASKTASMADPKDQDEFACDFARRSTLRFSEIIDPTLESIRFEYKLKPDNGQRHAIAERFAWITGDKRLCDYGPADIERYRSMMMRIPTTIRPGRLYKSGLMATPFDAALFPANLTKDVRSDRTINRDLSVLQGFSKYLSRTHWKSKFPRMIEMNFLDYAVTIKENLDDFGGLEPDRMPWTPDHLKAMYSLSLWQGGGEACKRLHPVAPFKVYQDAAFWVPLIGIYTGLSREEVCGLEVRDFYFDYEVPYLWVRNNMTKSHDGENPGGLKRYSRARAMPLHPQLLRLGLAEYVQAVAQEGLQSFNGTVPIFPELYSKEAKHHATGENVPAFGGRRFYAIAWRYIADATHAITPLPETRDGKKADFHSQRTYNQSVLASVVVSQALLDRHMGHALQGVGPSKYNKRPQALGIEEELRERLDMLIREMPNVSDHIPRPSKVNQLPLKLRSRVGSAPGRDAQRKYCA